MTDTIAQPKVEPKRDRFGRYLVKGKAYTRATTIAGTIEDRYNLELWKIRMTAIGLTSRHDLYAQVAANVDDKNKLNDICEAALEAAKGTAGANLGTALHTFTERVDLGETILIPAPWDADVAAYRAAMDRAGVVIVPGGVEKIVVLHDLQIAGTFDRLVTHDGHPLPLIADLKTGAGLDFSWGSIAIQLALYAHADEIYDPVTDTTSPMVPVDQEHAIVMHLPAGQATCTLHEVDIAAGWEAVQTCMDARAWRKRKNLTRHLTSVTATPTPAAEAVTFDLGERRAWLVSRIGLLRDEHPGALPDLAGSWPIGVPTFRTTHEHTAGELERVAAAITAVEAKHSVPFATGDDIDPADKRAPAEVLDALAGRLQKLPADIAATVAGDVAGKVPHLRKGTFTLTHVDILSPYLLAAEAEAARRFGAAELLLAELTEGDTQLLAPILAACGTDRYTWTTRQLETLTVIRDTIGTHLAYGSGLDDTITLTVLGGEKQLIGRYGDRKTAVAACKQIAGTFRLATPRLLSDVVATPALFAHAMSAPINPTISDSQETAA